MRWAVLVVLMAVVASPASAQVGFQFGAVAGFRHQFDEDARLGFYGGVHYDLNDSFQVGVQYANKGRSCCMDHSVEVPATYRRRFREIGYVLGGVAPGYGSEGIEVNILAGLGVEMRRVDRRVSLEVAFTYDLVGFYYIDANFPVYDKTFRVGLNVRR